MPRGGGRFGSGVPLSERPVAPAAAGQTPAALTVTGPATAAAAGGGDAGGATGRRRHCWVVGMPEAPGRWPALLLEWRRDERCWSGHVAFVVDEPDGSGATLLDAWVPDHQLREQ